MATKSKLPSKSNPTPAKIAKPRRLSTAQLVLVSLGVLVLGFFVYRFITIQIDRQNFRKAEKTVEKIESLILAEMGAPSRVSNRKVCSYTNFTYSKGALGCMVGVDFEYSNKNNKDADSIVAAINKKLAATGDLRNAKDDPIYGIRSFGSPSTSSEGLNMQRNYKDDLSGLKCVISYGRQPESTNTFHSEAVKYSANSLFISFVCSGGAKAEYYSLSPNSA
jgi:hypothetical protein